MRTFLTGDNDQETLKFWSNEWCWQALGLLLGPLIVYSYMILISTDIISPLTTVFFTPNEMLFRVQLLVINVVITSTWLWLVLRFICHNSLASLNRKPGGIRLDIRDGVLIAMVQVVAMFGSTYILRALFTHSDGHISGWHTLKLVSDPSYLIYTLTFGNWLTGAMREEFLRTMLLSQLWKLGNGKIYLAVTLYAASLLFGLCHTNAGWITVLSIAVGGIFYCYYYLRFGRPIAMIIGHGLYNTFATLSSLLSN